MRPTLFCLFFFFNDTATTEIYTLSLHDALPISLLKRSDLKGIAIQATQPSFMIWPRESQTVSKLKSSLLSRSEEHTSELQSRLHLVCRLLLEKKKRKNYRGAIPTVPHV